MTSLSFEAAALGAALMWAFGGLIAAGPSIALGGPRFTRLRMYWVAFALAAIATFIGDWSTLGTRELLLLAGSGMVGLALGDVALFTAFSRLGPRRTGILFAANAPMAAALSAAIFGERFSLPALIGSGLVMLGVTLAIAFGNRPGQTHHWEEVRGNLWVGVGFGLLAAAGQAVGVLLADPAFENGLDPWAGAAVRAIVGLAALIALRGYFEKRARVPRPARIGWKLWGIIIISGTIAMVFGKTLVLIALSNGDPGIVSVLISTAPALQLPLIWAVTKERPAAGAWAGALLASVGTAMIVV
ncbi:MAG: DMT family transporter [bacterium]|nr:DMT family transporter [bacterium]